MEAVQITSGLVSTGVVAAKKSYATAELSLSRRSLPSSSPSPLRFTSKRVKTTRCSLSAPSDGQSASKPNPFAEKKVYKDSITDLLFIAMLREAYAKIAGWNSKRTFWDGYNGMVEVSSALMRGRTPAQQLELVLQGFPEVPPWFRKIFAYTKWGAELNAWITPSFFSWLVGPAKQYEVEINGQMQNSGVKIEKCRYLETSGCVGMCVSLCKIPTQTFFTEQMGMPLTMNPNFEDLSCEMIFGLAPPPLAEDKVYTQPCFSQCPSANSSAPACPKLSS